MSLLTIFEESGKEVYQVTKSEWINIMQDHHINSCKRTIEEFNKYTKIEVECFHREQVTEALKKDITVSDMVLSDYIGLKEKIKAQQDKINAIPILTESIYNTLQEGNKITVNGYKVTIHKKENNRIIARLYKKQKQAIELIAGERYNLVIGW